MQYDFKKHNIGLTFKLSLAFVWISIFNAVFDNALPKILVDPVSEGGLGLNYTDKGIVMALDNIFGVFILPLFGLLSDKTRSKFGKRTPYIIAGALLAVISWGLAGYALYIRNNWFFIIALGAGLLFISMSRPASLAILPDFTMLHNRRKANAITQILSVVATLYGIILVTVLMKYGYYWIFPATVISMLIFIVLHLFLVKEKKYEKEFPKEEETESGEDLSLDDYKTDKKHIFRNKLALFGAVFFFYVSFNGLLSSLANYATEVLHLDKSSFTVPQLLTLVAACIVAVPVSKLQNKIKRKYLLIFGFIIMLGAFALAFFQNSMNALMIIGFILAGLGYSVSIVNLYPYVLELSDPRRIGRSTGVFNLVMMLAMVFTPIMSGFLIDKYSIKVLFPYCLAALLLGTVSLFFIYDKGSGGTGSRRSGIRS
jgi:Major Facilitator Superfamily.